MYLCFLFFCKKTELCANLIVLIRKKTLATDVVLMKAFQSNLILLTFKNGKNLNILMTALYH